MRQVVVLFFNLLTLLFLQGFHALPQCPPLIPDNLATHEFSFQPNATVQVTFSLCGTLADGCYTSGGGQICEGPGCCSVCLKWNLNGISFPGAACLGRLTAWSPDPQHPEIFLLNYSSGDPVPPPGPPFPGPREARIILMPGEKSTLTDFVYIDGNQDHHPGDIYMYYISVYAPTNPCGVIDDCGSCTVPTNNCTWCLSTSKCVSPRFLDSCGSWTEDPNFCPPDLLVKNYILDHN